MTSRPGNRTGRRLLRLAVAGAVAIGIPIALAGTAKAAPASSGTESRSVRAAETGSINTGNGLRGRAAVQAGTWRAYGGHGCRAPGQP